MTTGGAMATGGASSGSAALLGGPAQGVNIGTLPVAPRSAAAAIVRLHDVARVEVGALNYNMASTFDGRPTVGLATHQLPGTNALDVAGRVRQKMEELKARFPEGLDYAIAYDTTPFIRESVMDVVQTLLEAVALVVGLVGGLPGMQASRLAFGLAFGLALLLNIGPAPTHRRPFDRRGLARGRIRTVGLVEVDLEIQAPVVRLRGDHLVDRIGRVDPLQSQTLTPSGGSPGSTACRNFDGGDPEFGNTRT